MALGLGTGRAWGVNLCAGRNGERRPARLAACRGAGLHRRARAGGLPAGPRQRRPLEALPKWPAAPRPAPPPRRRKKKNNPILLGEPGVGKTAIAEGLARAIVTRTNADGSQLPAFLWGKRVMQLDVGLLIAGAKVRGRSVGRCIGGACCLGAA